MNFQQLIDRLSLRIMLPLPGQVAHAKVSPSKRLQTEDYLNNNPSYKSGCVTILLFPDKEHIRLLLMERSDGNDPHSGQISFPGGKKEMDDQSLEETALRETYEEVGIDPANINLIGKLSDIYIPASNYLVHPFLGYAIAKPETKLNMFEVKTILFPSLDIFLSNDLPKALFQSKLAGLIEAPYYSFEHHKIWGATAMMIRELVEMIKD